MVLTVLAWAVTRVYFLYVFCKFICSLGVDFYESSCEKAIIWVDFILSCYHPLYFVFDVLRLIIIMGVIQVCFGVF